MLNEFTRDVLKDIETARRDHVDKLIAADGNGRHDLIRGAIQALDAVKVRVDALVRSYSIKDGMQEPPTEADDRASRLRAYRRGA